MKIILVNFCIINLSYLINSCVIEEYLGFPKSSCNSETQPNSNSKNVLNTNWININIDRLFIKKILHEFSSSKTACGARCAVIKTCKTWCFTPQDNKCILSEKIFSPKFKSSSDDTLICYTLNRTDIMVGASIYPSSNSEELKLNWLTEGIEGYFIMKNDPNAKFLIVLKSVAEIHGIRYLTGVNCKDLQILVDDVLLIDHPGLCPKIFYLLSENPLNGTKVVIQQMFDGEFVAKYIEIAGKYL